MAEKQSSKAGEFTLVSNYKNGYRNREDITNLPPGVLIVGSQNVLTNVSERIQIRQGYALDGATSAINAPILSSYDWLTRDNGEVHLRAGFLTTAGTGKLQYRYVDSLGVVTWRDLITGLSSVSYNFTTFWNNNDGTTGLREVLFVNGASEITKWNGATTTFASATVNTVTKQGTDTWSAAGFYSNQAPRSIVIGGVSATYTGGEGTTTLTGVSVDFSATTVGSVIHQAPVVTLNSAMTNAMQATFKNDLISVLNNQVFVASLTASTVWISVTDSYTDYTFSTPRQVGQGWFRNLDANIVAFKPQEQYMYVSAGQDLWYNTTFSQQVSTLGITYEQVNFEALKTGKQQGAQSQAFVSHMKNNIIIVTNEPTIDMFGRMEQFFGTPQTKNISDPIKIDVDSYDFTDGSIFYFKYFIYVAVPKEGIVIVYNIATGSWESPQTLPISRFYIVEGELYGHSYNTSESYQLNTGFADRVFPGFAGYPIEAIATFSYQNFGSRATFKKGTKLYIEGYINSNTVMTATLTYEIDGCASMKSFTINGSDTAIVCLPTPQGSLGKTSLGKQKLGGAGTSSITGLPPKFRVIKTYNPGDFFECSLSFSILGVDNRFELLAFGLAASESTQIPVSITQ